MKVGAVTATVLAALLTLTACSAEDQTPAASGTDHTQAETTEPTTAEETEETEDSTVDLTALLEPESALGDYDDRWVNEWQLPKIPNYEITMVSDRSKATAEMWGDDTVKAMTVVGPYTLETISEYEAVLEQLGWSNNTDSYLEMGIIEEGVSSWSKRFPDEGYAQDMYITPSEPSDTLTGHISFDFMQSAIAQ